jgi:murein DD-endopeptidase MepM/ murein hydrolase activator NlpD
VRQALRASRSALLLTVLAATAGAPQDLVKRVGQVTFTVDQSRAFPGGVMVVRLASRGGLGSADAILDGRRAPFHLAGRIPRALVPVPVTAVAGQDTLGVQLMARTGRQRIPIEVTIAARAYPARTAVIPEEKRALLKQSAATRDGRQLLGLLRTETAMAPGPLRPPITIVPGLGFGSEPAPGGDVPMESVMDAVYGERHRGVDFEVPPGTVVMAPGAGTVLLAGPLTLSGQTLLIDHGQGVVSALFHFSRIDVTTGDHVEARAPVGLSGDTGIAPTPRVQWRTYLHGVAVDPAVLQQVLN